MILERFYSRPLAHASYLVGCAATGEAIVIDPGQGLDPYLAFAEREGLRITAVTETHIHADYLSGSRALAARTGAQLFLTDEGPADWKYEFANDSNVTLVRHGDKIMIGNLRLDVWHTPGHTPEHISFVLTDTPASQDPVAAFTGDFIFIGDVGRPDLLERAAGFEGTMEAGAKVLFESLRSFLAAMPDDLLIFPAHGAGSACGKSLGGVPVSALGYEKKVNWGLKVSSSEKFVDEVLSGQPEPPRYFAEMKARNKLGLTSQTMGQTPVRLTGFPESALVVDIRGAGEYGIAHRPGSINVPFTKSFLAHAGAILPYDQTFIILAEDEETAKRAASELALIGIDHLAGWISSSALEHEATTNHMDEMTVTEMRAAQNAGALVLDVRGRTETACGMLPGALNIPFPELAKRHGELPKDRQIIVHCQAGGRSPVAASYLRFLGFDNVANLPGGYDEIQKGVGETAVCS